ncbi:hypothetical protein GQ457_08G032460 [Hibiscus cannabinus]
MSEPRIDVPKLGITNDVTKVNVACSYLTDGALFWWRHRCSEVKGKDLPIGTWAEFQAEHKERIYPKDAQREARSKLRQLRHDKSILEYVKKFIEIKFQFPLWGKKEASPSLWMDCRDGMHRVGTKRCLRSLISNRRCRIHSKKREEG